MKSYEFNTKVLGKEYHTEYYCTAADIKRFFGFAMEPDGPLWAIDFETAACPEWESLPQAALSPHTSDIRLIQLFNGTDCFVLDTYGDPSGSWKKHLVEFTESANLIGHNSVFELAFLHKYGHRKKSMGCTMLAYKIVMAAKQHWRTSASLDSIFEELFKVPMKKHVQNSAWHIPELTHEQILYAATDAIATYRIAEHLGAWIEHLKLNDIYNLVKEVQLPIVKVKYDGFKLDKEAYEIALGSWRGSTYSCKKELELLMGISGVTDDRIREWLQADVFIARDYLPTWPLTESGKLSVDAHTLADYDFIPVLAEAAKYSKLKKITSAFGTKMLAAINPATNRIHANLNIFEARTGRYSCSSPNLQQIPRSEAIRSKFIAEAGNSLVIADFSQIEMRVAAELSGDQTLLEAYREGKDLYILTAAKLLGRDYDTMYAEYEAESKIKSKSVSKPVTIQRQTAKALCLGLLFGLGKAKFADYAKHTYGVETTVEEAADSIDAWRTLYAGYHAYQLNQAYIGENTGFATTPSGMVRRLDPDNFYGAAMNTPVQGGACEVLHHTLIKLYRRLLEIDALDEVKFCGVVHDEIILECERGLEPVLGKILEESMIYGYLQVFPNGIINGLAEASWGDNWASAK